MWLYSLPLALSTAFGAVVILHAMLKGVSVETAVWNIVADVLILVTEVVYLARLMMLLNDRDMKWNLKRSLSISLTCVLFSLIVSFALGFIPHLIGNNEVNVAQQHIPYSFLILLAVTVVIACLLLPFIYGMMKYFVDADCKYATILTKSYRTGLRFWGFIFVVLFLATLCAGIVLVLISMPFVITMIANLVSLAGVREYGDSTGLPQWFAFLQFGICTLAAFIGLFVNVFWMFAVYFMYGSIDTRLREKEEYLKTKE